MKNDHNIYLTNSLNSQDIRSLFTSQVLQPKMKCKDGGLYFYKNKKCRHLEIEKKNFSYFITEIPNFHTSVFPEKAQ